MISYRYQDRDTAVHRLSPFCKLLWVGCIMALAVTFEHPLYIGALFVATLPLVIAARIWRQWASIVIVFGLLLGVAMIFINAVIVNHGSTVLLEATFDIPTLGTPRITLEAIVYGLMWALKVLAIMSAFTLFNFTVHPDDQMLAMIQLRLPYKSVLVTSLSSRFAPTLFEDYDRLSESLRSRGLEIDKGRLHRRIANRGRLLRLVHAGGRLPSDYAGRFQHCHRLRQLYLL
jgi:energy-coupling factor transport system permease protein